MPYVDDRLAYIEAEETRILKRTLRETHEAFKKIAALIEDGKYQEAHGLCLHHGRIE